MLFSILVLICFLLVAWFRQNFNSLNLSINLWAASVNAGSFTLTAQVISLVFDTTALVILSVILAITFFVFHFRRYGLLLLFAMAGEASLVALFKMVIMSPRPSNGIIFESGYSFPSGHATSCVVFFGVVMYFVWRKWGSFKIKALTSGLYLSISAVVAFDRIYLNVHWFSDVVGSVFLGAFWISFCILLFKYTEENRIYWKKIFRQKTPVKD